jgi:hypothetical protein
MQRAAVRVVQTGNCQQQYDKEDSDSFLAHVQCALRAAKHCARKRLTIVQ